MAATEVIVFRQSDGMKPVSMELPSNMSYEKWLQRGELLKQATGAVQWWWGDWLNFGEKAYGEKYTEAVEQFGMNLNTATQYAQVAAAYEICDRSQILSWKHHLVAAPLPPDERQEALEWAATPWVDEDGKEHQTRSTRELRDRVRSQKLIAAAESHPLPDDTYRVIYADPPWKYRDDLIEGYGAAEHHYPTLDIDELCELKDATGKAVSDIAAPSSVLFMWATSPLLDDAFRVIDAWGFDYKTSFVWDKVKHNYGHYNSVRHELLLVSTRGSCTPDVKELVDSVVVHERSDKHSEKPQVFRDIIDRLYPSGRRIELFARNATEGWDVWGNEV